MRRLPISDTKRCPKCDTIKSVEEFHRSKGRFDGRSGWCASCANTAVKRWSKQNHKKDREMHLRWKRENKERIKVVNGLWVESNKDKTYSAQKRHRDKVRNTLKGRLNIRLSNSIRISLNGEKKNGHWEDLVGYTLDQLKRHLEKKFLHGMGWNNFGEWHIDHIIPVAAFNYQYPEDIDFKKCWSLKNLRPLWAHENQVKSAKIDHPFQPSLTI